MLLHTFCLSDLYGFHGFQAWRPLKGSLEGSQPRKQARYYRHTQYRYRTLTW